MVDFEAAATKARSPRRVRIKAQGSPADWTTDVWPAAWGPTKSVAQDGHGVERPMYPAIISPSKPFA